jgi:hypothetical protein
MKGDSVWVSVAHSLESGRTVLLGIFANPPSEDAMMKRAQEMLNCEWVYINIETGEKEVET